MEIETAFLQLRGQDVCLIPNGQSLRILTHKFNLDVSLPSKPHTTLAQLASLLDDSVIIGWGLKAVFSNSLVKTGLPWNLQGVVYDLQVLERFLGQRLEAPETFTEARLRLGRVRTGSDWNVIKTLWNTIYKPLTVSIIPQIESLGIAHTGRKQILYPFYEIEGQNNGRLKCCKVGGLSYNPHTISGEDKQYLSPTGHDDLFLMFDFQAMEVRVLAWLSDDPILKNIIASGNDVYDGIWHKLTNMESTEKSRKLVKSVFLPVVYGQGAKSISERTKISETSSNQLVNKIYKLFHKAMGYVSEQKLDNGWGTDHFGRRRHFEVGEEYKVRNFVIQAPASTICLHKLVKLGAIAKLVFHTHDAYCILASKSNWKQTYVNAIETLENCEELYPKLELKATCKGGRNLSKLNHIWRH